VVADWAADDTGENTVHGIIYSHYPDVGYGEVIKFPYGRFRFTGAAYFGTKKNFTIRGSGMGVFSASTVAFGTGTKVFTVPAGLGWSAGIGARVWEANKQFKWMKGTVISYSGTTLTLDITATSGHTDTISSWTVGQTVLERAMADVFFSGASTFGNPGGYTLSDVVGSPIAGATTVTVADGSIFYPGPCKFDMNKPSGPSEYYSTYGVQSGLQVHINYITSVVGNVLHLQSPLLFNLPAAQNPVVYGSVLHFENVGFEDYACFGEEVTLNGTPMISVAGGYNCWCYKVMACLAPGMIITTESSFRCEMNRVVFGWTAQVDGRGAAEGAMRSSMTSSGLYIHCVDYTSAQLGEGQPDSNCVYLFNTWKNEPINVCHGNAYYQLFEGNITPSMQWDAYYGGHRWNTTFRNLVTGLPAYWVPWAPWPWNAYLISNRFGRWNNYVGNVMGTPGQSPGYFSFGNPNMGNGESYGTANSVLFTESGGASGNLTKHLDAGGVTRIVGTLATKTDDDNFTVTLTSGVAASMLMPHNAGFPTFVHWAGGERHYLTIEPTSAGMTLVFSGNGAIPTNGNPMPAIGTVLEIYPGPGGIQELDLAVEYTAFRKSNFQLGEGGVGGAMDIPLAGGETLPESLSGGQPQEWGTGIPFPPVDSSAPNHSDLIIPSGHYYANGDWPAGMDAPRVALPEFSPPAAVYSSPQNVVISCPTPSSTIHFTTDGSTPTTSSPTYSTPIAVSATMTIKAIAVASGLDDSQVRSGTFYIGAAVATPTFSPPEGLYGGGQNVSILCDTAGATIHFTMDGSTPTLLSPTYSVPIFILGTTTFRAFAMKAGMFDSITASALIMIGLPSGGGDEDRPPMRSARAPLYALPATSGEEVPDTPMEERSDAVAVFDMQTLDNVVPGSSEYDLVGSHTAVGGTPIGPTLDSEGLIFPETGAYQNQSKAAGAGNASVSALTVYIAFVRAGATMAGPFGQTTLIDSNLLLLRTTDPEEHPRVYSADINAFALGRWNDGLPHLATIVINADRLRMFVDGCEIVDKAGATAFPANLTKLNLSHDTAGEGFTGKVFHFSVFNTAHDTPTRAQVFAQIKLQLAARGVTVARAATTVVIEGDSISQQNAFIGQTTQYHHTALIDMIPIPPAIDFAISGNVVADAVARASTVDALYDVTRPNNILAVFIGANNLPDGTAAGAFAEVKAYCLARKAVGWKIVYCTAVVRDLIPGFEAKRLAFNSLVRADDPPFYDALADFGADLYLGDPAQAPLTTYFVDGVHPNAAGHARMKPLWKTAVESLIE
jgi:hypothetical protein